LIRELERVASSDIIVVYIYLQIARSSYLCFAYVSATANREIDYNEWYKIIRFVCLQFHDLIIIVH